MNEKLEVIEENKCGTCQACCELLGIHELGKPIYERCPNQCEAGCSIYKDRPKECDTYTCFWLANGNFSEKFRPNNLRVILELSDSAWGKCLMVRELDKGASKNGVAREFIDYVADKSEAFIVIQYGDDRYCEFPPHSEHIRERVEIFYQCWNDAKNKSES